MVTLERNPRGFFNNVAVTLLVVIVAIATVYFVWSQLQPAEPEVPSVVSFADPVPPQVTYGAGDLILQEDFEIDAGSWELAAVGQAKYDGGALVLTDDEFDDIGWARPHLTFDNFILDVHTRWLGGAIGGSYGVQFRLDNQSGDYYAFYVHNDGRFTVGKQLGRDWFVVINEFSPAVMTNGGVNQLRIEAYEDHFRFFVNGQYLADVANEGIEKGDIRLVAIRPEGTSRFLAAFDNLRIARHTAGQVQAKVNVH